MSKIFKNYMTKSTISDIERNIKQLRELKDFTQEYMANELEILRKIIQEEIEKK